MGIVKTENSLYHTHLLLCMEWDYEKNDEIEIYPDKISRGSDKKVWWQCENGHKWMAYVINRTNGRGCPYCSGRYPCKENCLSTTNPELLKEWDYEKNISFSPSEISKGSHKKVWWKCDKGHSWKTLISDRIRDCNCPYCGNYYLSDENSFYTKCPELLKEWDYEKNNVKPTEIIFGSNKKVWWKCDKGHSWLSSIINRVRNKTGCPYCTGQKACKDNCLSTKNPKLATEWDHEKNFPLTPENITCGSNKKVWWKCGNGHSWIAEVNSRNKGNGCSKCGNIELNNGEVLDSFIEAWYYLLLKENNIDFIYDKKYGNGDGKRFDFYIPEINTYIEVTGFFGKTWDKNFSYISYLKKHC